MLLLWLGIELLLLMTMCVLSERGGRAWCQPTEVIGRAGLVPTLGSDRGERIWWQPTALKAAGGLGTNPRHCGRAWCHIQGSDGAGRPCSNPRHRPGGRACCQPRAGVGGFGANTWQ